METKTQSGNNTAHSILSASSAARWSVCPASAYLATKIEHKPAGYAAREGTGLHSLVELALLNGIQDASKFMQVPVPSAQDESVIEHEPMTDEQREAVQNVLNYVRGYLRENDDNDVFQGVTYLYTEQRVFYNAALGVPREMAFGTGDIAVLEKAEDQTVLHIMDAKFGRGSVAAAENPQLMLYAVGLLDVFELAETIDKVVLHIIQPRLSAFGDQWETTPQDIRQRVEPMRKPAQRVWQLVQEDGATLCDDDFQPSAKGCEWCPLTPCKYQQRAAEAAVLEMFEQSELGEQVPKITADAMNADELGRAMDLAELLEPFFEAVKDRVKTELNLGVPVTGYKLVTIRAGNRTWRNKDTVLEDLDNVFPPDLWGGTEFFAKPLEPRTPAQLLAEVKVKRGDSEELKEIKREAQAKLEELVIQGKEVTSIVPTSDPRPEFKPEPPVTVDDFEELA